MALAPAIAFASLMTLFGVTTVPTGGGALELRGLRGAAPAADDASAAEPASEEATGSADDDSPDEPAEVNPAQIEAALETGDLTTALELAQQHRQADPSDPARWAREAEVLEQKGQWVAAIAAWREAANRADADARVTYEDRIAELDPKARGQVEDEPASTHADKLDAARAARELAANPPPPEPAPEPAPAPAPKEKIVTKWYFWLTIGAIAASAGAITGIAIKSSIDERKRSAAGPGGAGAMGPTVLRF